MISELYPLKFKPIPQYRIWGGNKLNQILPKESQIENLGEIWCLSGITENVSVVENGDLKGKNLNEIIDTFQGKLLGKKVWGKFGNDFPLLIKFIDAAEPLSVQVHPNDEQAKRLHNSFGKSEMWYIMDAEKDAELIIGFENGITKKDYSEHLKNETLEDILHKVIVEKGDAVYIPAGRVHAIGRRIVLAEIQQTSDITYRIYDYNRIDKDGKKRELHTEMALDAIDFNPIENIKTDYSKKENEFSELINSPYFTTQIFEGNESVQMNSNDEFKIYVCTEGNVKFKTENSEIGLKKYECLLMPAEISDYEIIPENNSTLIEVKVP
ncbi:mannose-6-phosphate isomerase, class I [Moheibacter sediminis]|uniref:mannose-6-phosphate isomerase n=1 Tax=Moheibacter sediminis TaxID=1434700 RepID=A0A1W2BI28_9FLAO|nr:mannose-6-phosphate isomerase, class I [Moheibacter sediminis]SMC72531.1 mannose-6-phosphate isomerase, type 1 [Moheibacter sediminis]